MLVLKVPCAARGAEQAVELSAPWPAGRAPSARELSLSVCRHLARGVMERPTFRAVSQDLFPGFLSLVLMIPVSGLPPPARAQSESLSVLKPGAAA